MVVSAAIRMEGRGVLWSPSGPASARRSAAGHGEDDPDAIERLAAVSRTTQGPGEVRRDGAAPLAWRVGFGTTLALAMGTAPVALFAVAALAPLVTEDLGVSRTQLGLISTIAFVFAALGSTAAGKVIERLGGRRTLVVLFCAAALAIVVMAGSGSYAWLLLAVAVSGLGQSLSNPVTNHLVAREVGPGRRGLYMGFKQSGVQLCQFLVGVSLPAAAVMFGWRTATAATILLAGAGLALVLVTVPREPGRPHIDEVALSPLVAVPGRVKALAVFAMLMGASYQATNAYVPLYAFEALEVSAAAAGATTAVFGAVGCAARILWGRSGERTDHLGGVLAGVAVGAATATAVLGLATPDATGLLWAGAVLHAMTSPASTVVVMLALLRVAPVAQVGRSSGLVALGMYSGFASGPLLFGATVDRYGSYGLGWTLIVVLYLMAAWVGLLAFRAGPTTQARGGSTAAAAVEA